MAVQILTGFERQKIISPRRIFLKKIIFRRMSGGGTRGRGAEVVVIADEYFGDGSPGSVIMVVVRTLAGAAES